MDKERTKRRILEKTERISGALQSRKFVCIALLFLLGTLAIPAQTTIVYGQVTDGQTGEPIAGAWVSAAKGNKGTASDADGRYTLNLQGLKRAQLTCQYLGYRTERCDVALRDSVRCES